MHRTDLARVQSGPGAGRWFSVQPLPTLEPPSFRDWHIPLRCDRLTLREAYARLQAVGAQQVEVPLMVQLVENPRNRIPDLAIFHGAVDLPNTTPSTSPWDAAFTIGFTMGSTNQVMTLKEDLFAVIARHLYPRLYQFGDAELRVFRDAVGLGYISACQPLDRFGFTPCLDRSLAELRQALGLEIDLLTACYRIEIRRFPDSAASRRLVDDWP